MPLIKNSIHECQITGYTSEGLGVAKVDGQVIFIKNAVRDDVLLVKIVKVNKKIAFGIIDKIISPSPYRVESECSVSQKCGGCELFNMTYDEELYFKKNKVYDCLTRLAKAEINDFEIYGSKLTSRYRNKAQYPVSFDGTRIVSGFYRKNSHDVVHTDDCLIQTEKSNAISNTICKFLTEYNIKAYDEIKHTGTIRHIYIRTGFVSQNLQVCLVSTTFNIKHIEKLSALLQEKFPEISSFLINKNPNQTNQILGDEYKTIYGNNDLIDTLCGNQFSIAPSAFYQVNHDSAERLYQKAIEYCDFKGDETVLDMYCGAGTITLAVSKFVDNITGIEIVPSAIINAKNNATVNNITNASFVVGDAKDAVKHFENKHIDVIIVDPPRKGLDIDTINSLVTISPKKITYVSCDPATLARDVKEFMAKGYVVEKACAFDLFPRTKHVESIVSLVCNN